eukprot:9223214-Pyramimonas_sp.AAC.1
MVPGRGRQPWCAAGHRGTIRDQEANQEILRVLQAEDPGRASEVLQYVLNTAEERRVMDKVEEALQQMGGRVLAFEHDGLF